MVALKINLADVGERPISSTRAVFLSAPAHRPSATVDGRVITTTPYPIDVVAGLATVTVEPGELVVEIRGGLADSRPKRVTVPDQTEVTLQELLESAYTHEPPVVSLVKQYLDETKVARDQAVLAADGVAEIAEDVAQVALDRAAAEAARDAAQGFAGDASESRGLAAVSAVSADDSATLAGQRDTSAASHASNASASAAAAGQSETIAAQHKVDAESAADIAVSTAAGIQDVAADAAQVAQDRLAVESAASAVASDRQTVNDARSIVVAAKADVVQIKTDVVQAKASIENTANLVDQTLEQYGAQFATEREASQQAVLDATAQAERAEQAADDISAGAVADGAVSTPKLQNGAVTKEKTSSGVQTSLDKADTSVQEGDPRLTNTRPPTAHSHAVADVTGLQGALDGKASTSHAHTEAQVTGLTAKLAAKADLDGSGQILAAQIPAVALTDFLGAVGTQAAMLALTGQRGDWCTRTDRGTDWQLIAEPSSTLANWREKTYPASPVSSVNGRTGAVDTSSADITDATAVGRNVIKAADAAAARAAIGAGTSSLTTGTTGSTAAAGNDSRLSNTRTPTTGTVPYDTTLPGAAEASPRKVGYNDCELGIKLQRAVTFTSVTFRGLTADASGNLVVELRKNGTAVSGTSTTIAAGNQVAGGTSTGTWAFAKGDVLTVYVTGVGTSPGKGLVADLEGLA